MQAPPSGQSPALFTVAAARLAERFGRPRLLVPRSANLAPVHGWWIRFGCGLTVTLTVREHGETAARIAVSASETDRDHLLFHLELDASDICEPTPDRLRAGLPAYAVLRLDDNGNQFEVTRATSACQANAIAATYEARGHKQTYWIHRLDVAPRQEG